MIVFTVIRKVIGATLATMQVADTVYTKVRRWNKQRKADKARKQRLIREIKKS